MVTVNPFVSVTISELVETVTSRAPEAAAGSILSRAETLVAEFTVKDATVMPAPKLAEVVP